MFFSPDIILSIFLFTFRNPLDIFERIPEEIEKKKHNRKFCLTYYYYLLFLLYFRILIGLRMINIKDLIYQSSNIMNIFPSIKI